MTHTELYTKPQSTKCIPLKSSVQFDNVICEPSVLYLVNARTFCRRTHTNLTTETTEKNWPSVSGGGNHHYPLMFLIDIYRYNFLSMCQNAGIYVDKCFVVCDIYKENRV